MKTINKIEELLTIMGEHTCKVNTSLPHKIANENDIERIIKPCVYHAIELVEKMLKNNLEPLQVFKTFKLVLCTHQDNDMQNLLCHSIREGIIYKYV